MAQTCTWLNELPRCPRCGALARPNILMFGDWQWSAEHSTKQQRRLQQWLHTIDQQTLAVIEIGAGTAVPTVRHFSEQFGTRLIRINPNTPKGSIHIRQPALTAFATA